MSGIVQRMLSAADNRPRLTHPEFSGPSVHAQANFNLSADVAALDKAIQEKGVDEKSIISLLTSRSNAQRQLIKFVYKQTTGKTLEENLSKVLSGKVANVILALLKLPAVYDAYELKNAMKGLGTDEETLIDILVTRDNKEMKKINATYKEEFDTDLAQDISSETSGDFCNILVELSKGERSEDARVDDVLADKDARALYEAGEKIKTPDMTVFLNVLTKKSFPQLRKVFQNYPKYSKSNLSTVVDMAMKGDVERTLMAIVTVAESKPGYFAEKLFESMKGSGTNDKLLIRTMVSRSETDMKEIKATYKRYYGKALGQAIMDELQGDYQTSVLALAGDD